MGKRLTAEQRAHEQRIERRDMDAMAAFREISAKRFPQWAGKPPPKWLRQLRSDCHAQAMDQASLAARSTVEPEAHDALFIKTYKAAIPGLLEKALAEIDPSA